jgi:hypothetical protein
MSEHQRVVAADDLFGLDLLVGSGEGKRGELCLLPHSPGPGGKPYRPHFDSGYIVQKRRAQLRRAAARLLRETELASSVAAVHEKLTELAGAVQRPLDEWLVSRGESRRGLDVALVELVALHGPKAVRRATGYSSPQFTRALKRGQSLPPPSVRSGRRGEYGETGDATAGPRGVAARTT